MSKPRLAVLIFLLLVALLFVPPVFQFLVRQFIAIEAWRNDATVQIAELQGSLLEPVTIRDAQWTQTSHGGVVLHLDIQHAEAEFSWHLKELFSGTGDRWFRSIVIDGVTGKVELPPVKEGASKGSAIAKTPKARWAPSLGWIVPERMEARNADFVLSSNGDYVRFEGIDAVFSQVEPGKIHAKQIAVHQPVLTRTFRDVKATTSIEDSAARILDLTLEPGVVVKTISAVLPELGRGRLDGEVRADAFGGNMVAQIRTLDDPMQSGIDASGTFTHIGIAPLATFLGFSEAAGGTIQNGQFTFRGTPRNASRASATLRMSATNFQWESRQWDSLNVGATLMDRQIEVPELELRQGHNQLRLSGHLTLPAPKMEWWQSDFDVNLSASIGNLTELSALMLPQFTYAAGRMSIDGAIRGHEQQFHGAVIVSGSGITWHNAPIEDLRAAIRLNGNELQIANLDLINKDDFLRGRGVINILGPKQYWGELRASVADLATYSAILQKPIVPEPLAGGATIDWSGEGSEKGYSGKFSARLNKLRTLGSTGALLHPVNAELEGDYSTAALMFSRFNISDEESSLTANVTVGSKVLTLASLKLMHQQEVCLEGDAVLPLDLWQSWPTVSLDSLLTDKTTGKVNLTARHLQLRPAAQLTGWKWPVDGIVDGTLSGEGAFGSLTSSGHLSLKDGRLPLGWSGKALTGVQGEFGFAGQKLTVEKFECTAPEQGAFSVQGDIDFATIRDPSLHLTLNSAHFQVPLFTKPDTANPPSATNDKELWADIAASVPLSASIVQIKDLTNATGLQTDSALTAEISGPTSSAVVQGKATLTAIPLFGGLYPKQFLFGTSSYRLPPLFAWRSLPWRNWKFAIDCTSAEPVPLPGGNGTVQPRDLKLVGTGATPALVGAVDLKDIPVSTKVGQFTIDEGSSITFREGLSDTPSVSIQATGRLLDRDVIAYALGPISHLVRFVDTETPLTPERFRKELESPTAASLSPTTIVDLLHLPARPAGETPVFEWNIPTPSTETATDTATPASTPASSEGNQ